MISAKEHGFRDGYNGRMFFRRERPKSRTFQEKVENLKSAGFGVASISSGALRVTRGCYAVDLKDAGGEVHVEDRAGVLIGDEIGILVDGGYQKFFRTPH